MDKNEEIYEIDRKIDSNSEKIELVHRRLCDLQYKESYCQSKLFGHTKSIENMSYLLQGENVLKLQANAFDFLEETKIKVEKAFLSEREQLENALKSLELENDELLRQKHELQEED